MEILYQTSEPLTFSLYVNGALTDPDGNSVIVDIIRVADNVSVASNISASRIGEGKYEYSPSTADNTVLGRFKVTWTYIVNANTNYKTDYYNVVIGYSTAQEFREDFPELAGKSNVEIYRKEQLARFVINSFCQQSFDFELNKTITVYGESRNILYLTKRLYLLTQLLKDGTDDLTSFVDIYQDKWLLASGLAPTSQVFDIDIKRGITEPLTFFTKFSYYKVKGNWGWEVVPEEIRIAARLLMADYFNDDSLLRQHGIIAARMGDREIHYEIGRAGTNVFATSTGNYDADTLLANYIDLSMELI